MDVKSNTPRAGTRNCGRDENQCGTSNDSGVGNDSEAGAIARLNAVEITVIARGLLDGKGCWPKIMEAVYHGNAFCGSFIFPAALSRRFQRFCYINYSYYRYPYE